MSSGAGDLCLPPSTLHTKFLPCRQPVMMAEISTARTVMPMYWGMTQFLSPFSPHFPLMGEQGRVEPDLTVTKALLTMQDIIALHRLWRQVWGWRCGVWGDDESREGAAH